MSATSELISDCSSLIGVKIALLVGSILFGSETWYFQRFLLVNPALNAKIWATRTIAKNCKEFYHSVVWLGFQAFIYCNIGFDEYVDIVWFSSFYLLHFCHNRFVDLYTLRLDDSRSPTICLVKSEVVARGPLLFLRKLLFDRALFLKAPHPRLTVNHGLRSSYWPSILTDAYEIKKRTQRYFLRENRMTQSSFSFFIKPFAKNRFQCF